MKRQIEEQRTVDEALENIDTVVDGLTNMCSALRTAYKTIDSYIEELKDNKEKLEMLVGQCAEISEELDAFKYQKTEPLIVLENIQRICTQMDLD